jgi:hypothetical protein
MSTSIRNLAFYLFGLSTTAVAQHFSVGLLGGASVTQDFQNVAIQNPGGGAILADSTPRRWIAGAIAEVQLPLHFALEADGLYHELGITHAEREPNGTLSSVSPAATVTWEFPVLAKYRFSRIAVLTPFVEAGPTFRTAGNISSATPSNHGVAVGAGAEVSLWKLRVIPQVRYVRWAEEFNTLTIAAVTVPNQIEVLVGITF